ncbi:unnamed protein product, partial [Mesorhabditis belari]|uniref:hydroxymethylglutaryl-CoA lyase n=1 Tax=Mesorhabditis belari TaxID=2138241 RepID=A0AAF3F2K3_9BILA
MRSLAATRRLVSLQRRDFSNNFRIVEVGARDGLQNEKNFVPTETKLELINRLAESGLKTIEVTSFVAPKWVPQMADHKEIVKKIRRLDGVSYPVLVPNLKGLESAIATGKVDEIALFVAASDAFNKKNINCTTDESVQRAAEVAKAALKEGIRVRGYISTVIGCPYQGDTDPREVLKLSEQLLQMGCYEISLGDTIGVGTPGSVAKLLDALKGGVPFEKLAVHFHDTFGQALANTVVSIEKGIRVADSSIAGLGGCPYAKGATGNLATEDLAYMLNGMGLNTGVDLGKLVETGQWICEKMGRQNSSRAASAILNKQAKQKC